MSRGVHKLLSFRGSPLDQGLIGHSVGGRTQAELTFSLKPFLVNDRLTDAFARVDRAEFTPNSISPYANIPMKVTARHSVSSPQFHAQQLSIVADVLISGAICLDLGCGTGYLAAVMAEMGVHRVVALEADEQMCDWAFKRLRRYGNQVEVVLDKNAEYLTINSALFNAIIAAPFFPCLQAAEKFIDHHLAVDGLACIAARTEGDFQQLFQATKTPEGIELHELMQVACEPLESRTDSVDATRWLEQWRTAFESRHSRKPSMKDINEDREALEMFTRFSKSRKYDPRL